MQEEDTYLSIGRPSEGLYKDKGSKFLAFAYPVDSEEDVKLKLQILKKKYYDATHHCYAYLISNGSFLEISRSNDDGEPAHTAGTPILNQIRSQKLSNVLVVVVRYYGGTNLGVPGLIQAYKTATEEALGQAEKEWKIIKEEMQLLFDYQSMNEVMKIIKQNNLEMISQEMDLQCKMKMMVRKKALNQVKEQFGKIDGLQFL